MKHIRRIIRESLKGKLQESVTISPDEQEYDNILPDMRYLLDYANIIKQVVVDLYYKYDFFKELVQQSDYRIGEIVFFDEGYGAFNYDDLTGPVHDQYIENLPESAKEWVIKAVKKRLNDLEFKYTLIPADKVRPGASGVVWMIHESPGLGQGRPEINLSNSNYSYIFHQLFGLTDSYSGRMTANEVKDIALQLIAASDEFSRSDKICVTTGKGNRICASSEEDAKYLSRVGRLLLEFAEQCIAQNFNKLTAS